MIETLICLHMITKLCVNSVNGSFLIVNHNACRIWLKSMLTAELYHSSKCAWARYQSPELKLTINSIIELTLCLVFTMFQVLGKYMSMIKMLFLCIVCMADEGVLFCANEYVYLRWTLSLWGSVKEILMNKYIILGSWKVNMSFSLRIGSFLNKRSVLLLAL